jgi:hypothetical protein
VVNGTSPQGVADLAGNALDGNADGTRGDAYDVRFARGSNFRYADRDGDLVTLTLQRGGSLELRRGADGAVQQVRIVGRARTEPPDGPRAAAGAATA